MKKIMKLIHALGESGPALFLFSLLILAGGSFMTLMALLWWFQGGRVLEELDFISTFSLVIGTVGACFLWASKT